MILVIKYIESGIDFCHDNWDYCTVGMTVRSNFGCTRFINCYDARHVLPVRGTGTCIEYKYVETIKMFIMLNVATRTRC